MRYAARPTARGFTIIELLIATAIFGVIMLVVTVGVLQFSRQYYKGVLASTTQGAARALIDDVTRSVQFNSGGVFKLANGSGYCIGSAKRYSYVLNRQVVDGTPDTSLHQVRHGLVSDSVTGCNVGTPALSVASLTSLSGDNARELLGPRMRLTKFDIKGNDDIYTITVRIVNGDDDLLCSPAAGDCDKKTLSTALDAPDLQCKSFTGSQYCAVAELQTTVRKRLD